MASPLMTGRHALVTGGAGFIGSHLVERLLGDGVRVTVIDDLSTGRLENLASVKGHPGLRVLVDKVSACAELPKTLGQVDFVFHLAAAVGVELVVKSPIHVLETNLHETEILLDLLTKRPVPILLASTSEVYGKSAKEVFSEGDDLLIGPPHQARWSYACSKLMDEFLALSYAKERHLPVTIVRLFNTVGPRQTGRYGMVLPRFVEAALAGAPVRVYGDGLQSRCFCFVQDTVEALARLSRCPAALGEVFNVGSSDEVTILELARIVIERTGSTSRVEFVPYHQAYEPGFEDMRRRKPLLEKLEKTIGFRPLTPLNDIVDRTVNHFRGK